MRIFKFRGIPEDELFDTEDGKFRNFDGDEIYIDDVPVVKGKFVYGNLIVDKELYYIVGGIIDTVDGLLEYWIPVKPETVGQFINKLDKNCVEIYEGDIVKTNEGNWIGTVVFANAMFMVVDKKGGYSYNCDWEVFEVIGN